MRSCQAAMMLSPQPQTNSLRGWKQTLMLLWHDTWSMFRELLQNFVKLLKRDTTHLLKRAVSTNMCLILCESDSVSTIGTQDFDVGRKMFLRNKSQASGLSSHYQRHVSMSSTTFSRIGSTWLIAEDVRCSSTTRPSTPILTSSPFTFMRPSAICLIKLWKKDQGWVVQDFWQCLLKKTEYARKLILTIRAIMISQQVDLLAGDFNGVAWRSSTKLLRTALCQRRRALLWGLISIRNNWADVCGAP